MKVILKDIVDSLDIDKVVEEKIFSDEVKDKLVKKMNDAIDIPFISEKTEGKAIDSMVGVIFGVFRGVLGIKQEDSE